MKRNDGGSAFPGEGLMMTRHPEGGDETHSAYFSGMSLRDWFAGQAPPPPDYILDTSGVQGELAQYLVECEAKWRYMYADAMLAERERGE